jgi:hypothetical protein
MRDCEEETFVTQTASLDEAVDQFQKKMLSDPQTEPGSAYDDVLTLAVFSSETPIKLEGTEL